MIINIRGTSGSGKTTLVKRFMQDFCRDPVEHFIEGRKRPYWTELKTTDYSVPVAVPGHYHVACGGCDTISKMDDVHDLVRRLHGYGNHVIYEGLLISADTKRTIDMARHASNLMQKMVVIHIDLPVEECIQSVNERRWRKNPDKPGVNPKNTISKHRGVASSIVKLRAAGVECHSVGREEAWALLTGLFKDMEPK